MGRASKTGVANEVVSNETVSITAQASIEKRKRSPRLLPALSYEDCLIIGSAMWEYSSGQKIRRLTLFDHLGKSPESGPSRTLVTASNKYGIINGATQSEYIELTPKGSVATSADSLAQEKIRANFELAISSNEYFQKLYDQYKEMKVPSRQVMMDYLNELGLEAENQQKCVDLFLVNAKYIGLIKILSGTERIISIEHLIEDMGPGLCPQNTPEEVKEISTPDIIERHAPIIPDPKVSPTLNWEKLCFYISPIGSDESEQRKHADLFMSSIVEPALEELGLSVVRADSINSAGIITAQIIEYIVNSKLVIADLSFHNPNVFYELSLRHSLGKPSIHLIRKSDAIPFDIHSFRTIVIDTSSIYTLVPQIESYKTAILAQARQLIESPDITDNPIISYLNKNKRSN